jgi:hypothetical protein
MLSWVFKFTRTIALLGLLFGVSLVVLDSETVIADAMASSEIDSSDIRTFAASSAETKRSIDVGGATACALVAGKAYCWGDASTGNLGVGPLDSDLTWAHSAVPVDTDLNFLTISVGFGFACALTLENDAYCWGLNTYTSDTGIGSLGIGSTVSSVNRPTKVSGDIKFAVIDTGRYHSCGVAMTGDTYCWGGNYAGELGDGTNTSSLVPKKVGGIPSLVAVSAGFYSTCGITSANDVYCWGSSFGTSPTLLVGAPKFTTISVHDGFICGIAFGVTYCRYWQEGSAFQSITGSYTQVSVGERACAVGPLGMSCWWKPTQGPDRKWYYNPVSFKEGIIEAAVGDFMYCGRLANENIFCTVNGYGSSNYSDVLLPVRFAEAPTNSTPVVSGVSTVGATVTTSFNPGGLQTKTSITYSKNLDLSSASSISSPILILPQAESPEKSWTLTELSPGTQYFYQVTSKNIKGTTESQKLSFVTRGGLPISSAPLSRLIGQNSAQIAMSINPNHLATTVELQVSETSGFTSSKTFVSSDLLASGSDQSVTINANQLRESTTYYYRIKSTNLMGITESETRSFTTLPPVGVSVNDGDLYSNSANVELQISWPLGATGALVSNDGGFSNQTEFELKSKIIWTLRTSGDFRQPRNVYVKFILEDGSRTSPFVDDITYDPNAPSIESITGSLDSGQLALRLRATDDVSGLNKVEIKNGTRTFSQNYAENLSISISNISVASAWASVKKLSTSAYQVRVSDGAGNWSNWKDFSLEVGTRGGTPGSAPTVARPKVTTSKPVTAKSIATFAKIKVLATSKVSLKVVASSKKFCKVSGKTLKGLKAGSCKVTVTVTPKKGRATSKTVTLKVIK